MIWRFENNHFRRSKLKGLCTWRVLPPNNTEMSFADHLAKAVPHPKMHPKKNHQLLSQETNLNRNETDEQHGPNLQDYRRIDFY